MISKSIQILFYIIIQNIRFNLYKSIFNFNHFKHYLYCKLQRWLADTLHHPMSISTAQQGIRCNDAFIKLMKTNPKSNGITTNMITSKLTLETNKIGRTSNLKHNLDYGYKNITHPRRKRNLSLPQLPEGLSFFHGFSHRSCVLTISGQKWTGHPAWNIHVKRQEFSTSNNIFTWCNAKLQALLVIIESHSGFLWWNSELFLDIIGNCNSCHT